MPKVSVLLPTYNTPPQYLRECIDSILGQTLEDFELLIVDDCSTSTAVKEVLDSYSDKRIKKFKNEKNLGISQTRNRLIDFASGEYLAVVDHDDISMPKRFELQAGYMDIHPEVGVAGCARQHLPSMQIEKFPEENSEILDGMMYSNILPHQGLMLRKSMLVESGVRYEDEFTPAEDYRLCLQLIGKTQFVNLQSILVQYRKHPTNTSVVAALRCNTSVEVARDIARKENHFIWYRARSRYSIKTRYKLFGKITVMTVYQTGSVKEYRLFDLMTLLIQNKSNRLPRTPVESKPAL